MKLLLNFLAIPMAATAFSASTFPVRPSSTFDRASNTNSATAEVPARTRTTTVTADPWRIVLDIGREPLATMPFDWARSGCRMPIVVPCDFRSDQLILPRSDSVSFTGPDGAVVRPVEGGTWQLANDKELSFTLKFPEAMARRDVWIDAGTTMTLQGVVYTKDEVDRLNDEFYTARDEAWKIGGELNDMARRKEAPKKWNQEKQQWEKRYESTNVLELMQKQISYVKAQAVQQRKGGQRPNPKTLSDLGSLPGIESGIFMRKEGSIRILNNNKSSVGPLGGSAVIGKWFAEPISDKPRSYYN
jgi:hypothetical protein